MQFIQGILLGLAYVAPIGMQNLYVIQSALQERRWDAIRVAWITIFFDITLALACFFGIGILIETLPILRLLVLGLGGLVVVYIGISLIRTKIELDQQKNYQKSGFRKHVMNCFAVTWLNPQALIDGSLLLGGFRASLTEGDAVLFILGVCVASFCWFQGLSLLTSIFHKSLNKKVLKGLNVLCGSLLVFYGIRLLYGLFSELFF